MASTISLRASIFVGYEVIRQWIWYGSREYTLPLHITTSSRPPYHLKSPPRPERNSQSISRWLQIVVYKSRRQLNHAPFRSRFHPCAKFSLVVSGFPSPFSVAAEHLIINNSPPSLWELFIYVPCDVCRCFLADLLLEFICATAIPVYDLPSEVVRLPLQRRLPLFSPFGRTYSYVIKPCSSPKPCVVVSPFMRGNSRALSGFHSPPGDPGNLPPTVQSLRVFESVRFALVHLAGMLAAAFRRHRHSASRYPR